MWYVSRDDRREGPLSDEQLRQLVREGQLKPGDLVLQEGDSTWVSAASLAPQFQSPPPAPATAPGPEGPAGAYQTVLARAVDGLVRHVRRALAWNLDRLPVTPREQARLAGLGIHEPVLQRYLAWRRSVLLVTCLPVTLIALLTTLDRFSDELEYRRGLGNVWRALQILAPYALPISAAAALLVWPHQRRSRQLLAWGWLIAFLVPLLLFLVPADWVFDIWKLPARFDAAFHKAATYLIGIAYFLWLAVYLPVFVVSVTFGIQRGCLRLKSLFPQSSVPGLLLIVSAPVFPLVLFPIFVLFNQVASNPLLLGGMWLLLASPLVYAAFGRTFLRPLVSDQDRDRMTLAQGIAQGFFWLGTLLLLIYATTHVWEVPDLDAEPREDHFVMKHLTILGFTSEGSLFRPWDWRVIRWLAVESLGRTLFTTVVVTDLFVRLNRSVWYYHKQLAGDPQADMYDRAMSVADQTEVRVSVQRSSGPKS
jgi:hypothetical protein